MGRPLLVDSNDQHRQKKRRFSSSSNTLVSLPLNILYTLATSDDHDFPRESSYTRMSDDGTIGETRESRALSSRRKNRVYTETSGSIKQLVSSFNEFTFIFTTGAKFRPFLSNAPVPNRGKSRHAPDRINVENPSNES